MLSFKQLLDQQSSAQQTRIQQQQNVALKPLLLKLELQHQLDAVWKSVAPELHPYSKATTIKDHALTIVAESGLIAQKIKLLTPELLSTLQLTDVGKILATKGDYITAIKVKVQAKSLLKQQVKSKHSLSHVASEQLAMLANQTQNQQLARVLQKLIKHHID